MSSPLVPAEAAAAGDGTPYSRTYDDVYHSAHGGLAQARHVFLAGNDLPARWTGAGNFVICETGFGLGLNFLTTWQAWRESGVGGRLHFVSVEKHPFHRDDLAQLLAPHTELASLSDELLRQWPPLTPGFHRLHFDHGKLTLTLLFGDATALLPQLLANVDAVYLDGFAPAKNPDLWSPTLLAAITRLCNCHATLATWSVAGELRRALERAGWQLERRPGFAAKREMLIGMRGHAVSSAPTFPYPQSYPPSHPPSQRRAIVIGAGLAGAAISERLANRGWHIDLFERHAAPAQETSGNPLGILPSHLANDDSLAARLSRACYLYALQRATLLAASKDLVHSNFNTAVAALRQTNDGWQVFDDDGKLLAGAPHVVLTNACATNQLLPGAGRVIAADGYAALLKGRVGLRAAVPDRLPLIGTLPDTDAAAGNAATMDSLPRRAGLHALLGPSTPGMVWVPLAAELLASQLEGEPLPMERELAAAVDPARFHLRALRRGR
jgi:tRNA 5-methylaminomethyl-2-thiouridine biosynthesis bifunctional protein